LKRPFKFTYSLYGVIVFFLLFYTAVLVLIEPVLNYYCRQPVFFFGSRFFEQFLEYPGGLIEYAGSFLSQFFTDNWTGALIVSFAAFVLFCATRMIRRFFIDSYSLRFFDWLPCLLLFSIHGRYYHPLAVTLGFIFTIGMFIVYLRSAGLRPWQRFVLFALFSMVVYYHAGGHLLLFALLCALYEILVQRHYILGAAVVILSSVLPWLAYRLVFMISLQDAFTRLLPFGHSYPFAPGPYLLYAFFPFLFILNFIFKRQLFSRIRPIFSERFSKMGANHAWLKRIAYVLSIAVIAIFLILSSLDSSRKTVLKIGYYAAQENWQQVLTIAEEERPTHILAQYHVNRALYHTDRLSTDLFLFPQDWGVNGLILPLAYNTAPLEKSKVFLELGHINEALRWSHETLTIVGETPEALKQLVIINLLKNELPAAEKYLKVLRKTFFRKWADDMEHQIQEGSVFNIPRLRFLKNRVNQSDFLIRDGKPLDDVESILNGNPANQMAFEYLMAGYLMTGQIGQIKKQIQRFRDFGYTTVPQPYKEALFLYEMQQDPETFKASIQKYSGQMVSRFQGFRSLMMSRSQGRTAILKQLRNRYGDTFWYYMVSKNIQLH